MQRKTSATSKHELQVGWTEQLVLAPALTPSPSLTPMIAHQLKSGDAAVKRMFSANEGKQPNRGKGGLLEMNKQSQRRSGNIVDNPGVWVAVGPDGAAATS